MRMSSRCEKKGVMMLYARSSPKCFSMQCLRKQIASKERKMSSRGEEKRANDIESVGGSQELCSR